MQMHIYLLGETTEGVAIQNQIIELAGTEKEKELAKTEFGKAEGDEECTAESGTRSASADVITVKSTDKASTDNGKVKKEENGDRVVNRKGTEEDMYLSPNEEEEASKKFHESNAWLPTAASRTKRKR